MVNNAALLTYLYYSKFHRGNHKRNSLSAHEWKKYFKFTIAFLIAKSQVLKEWCIDRITHLKQLG